MSQPSSPQGWENLELKLKRDKKLHGVFFEFSETQLTFYGDAFDLIKLAYDTDNLNAIVGLRIEYSPYSNGDYTPIIEGTLNFSEYSEDHNSVTINVEQVDRQVLFKNRKEHEFNLIGNETIGGVDLSSVNAGLEWGLILQSRGIIRGIEVEMLEEVYADESAIQQFAPRQFVVNNDFEDPNIFPDDLVVIQPQSPEQAGDYEISISLDYEDNMLAPNDIIGFKKDTGGIIVFLGDTDPSSGTIDYTFNFNVQVGEQLGVYLQIFSGSVKINKGVVKYRLLSYEEDRQVNAITLGEAFRNATQRLLDNEVLFKSDLLGFPDGVRDDDGYFPDEDYTSGIAPDLIKYYKFLVLNGFYVRGFPSATEKNPSNEDAKPFTVRFDKFFDSANAIIPLGAGFDDDGSFRVDGREWFYDSSQSYDLGLVDKREIVPDLAHSYDLLKHGYKRYENDEDSENALLGIHGQIEWNTPIDRYDNEFASVSEFIADMYSIELTRRQEYDSQTKRGWKYDKDTFIIHAYRQNLNNWTNYQDRQIDSSSDLQDPATVYNVAISTHRNARRFQKWTAAALRPFHDDDVCNFISGEPNTRPSVQLDGTAPVLPESAEIRESDDLEIDAVESVFNGRLYKIEKTVELEEWIMLKNSSRNLIRFSYINSRGIQEDLKGYIDMLSYKPEESLIRLELIGA